MVLMNKQEIIQTGMPFVIVQIITQVFHQTLFQYILNNNCEQQSTYIKETLYVSFQLSVALK